MIPDIAVIRNSVMNYGFLIYQINTQHLNKRKKNILYMTYARTAMNFIVYGFSNSKLMSISFKQKCFNKK